MGGKPWSLSLWSCVKEIYNVTLQFIEKVT